MILGCTDCSIDMNALRATRLNDVEEKEMIGTLVNTGAVIAGSTIHAGADL